MEIINVVSKLIFKSFFLVFIQSFSAKYFDMMAEIQNSDIKVKNAKIEKIYTNILKSPLARKYEIKKYWAKSKNFHQND
jgi:hypothetical protein